jgi:hypothetical protein
MGPPSRRRDALSRTARPLLSGGKENDVDVIPLAAEADFRTMVG